MIPLATKKKIFLAIAISLVFLNVSACQALEISWPKVPGAIPPQEIERTVAPSNALPYLVNYFVHLFLVIAIGITVVVVVWGGISYILAGARPKGVIEAREKISQGLLGLLIIASSYVILSIINPQLLVFHTKRGETAPLSEYQGPTRTATTKYLEVPFGTFMEKTLSNLEQATTVASLDPEIQNLLHSEFGDHRSSIHSVEVPLLEMMNTLDKIVELTEGIQDDLEGCTCGQSLYDVEFNTPTEGRCIPGKKSDTYEATTTQEYCLKYLCNTCGTSTPDCRLDDAKNKKIEIEKLFAKLSTQYTKLGADQINLIEKTLRGNAGEFLLKSLREVSFYSGFEKIKNDFAQAGEPLKFERPKQFPEPETITLSPPSLDPLTYYAPLEGKRVPIYVEEANKKAYHESQRFSAFSVLTRLSIEEIEQLLNQCLTSAFGQGEFLMSHEKFVEITEKTIKNGLADFLNENVAEQGDEITETFTNNLDNGLKNDFETKADTYTTQCKTGCAGDAECIKKCDTHIPPHFLSNKLLDVLTQDIQKRLPSEIQELLKKRIREVVFDKDINEVLTDDIADVLDNALQGALTKSLEDQMPFLKKELNKKITQALPSIILDPLQTVDRFLMAHLKDLRKRVDKDLEELANELASLIAMPATALIEKYKSGHKNLFRDKLPLDDCVKYINEGYYFNVSQNKCKKASPEDVNNLWNADIATSLQIASHVGSPTENTTQEDFCRNAGHCWNKLENKCEECSWVNFKNLKPTKGNFERLKHQVLAGLVNFAEQFLVALTKTATYTLVKYTQIWVEDEIIAPLQPYLKQLAAFEKGLHKFLNSTIRDVLPRQLRRVAENNIEQNIAMLCNGQSITIFPGMTFSPSSSVQETACNIQQKLQSQLINEIPQEIKDVLQTKVQELLPENIQEILNKSPAELFWPNTPLAEIQQIITGTPKDLLCGKNPLVQNYADKCAGLQDTNYFYPTAKQNDPKWQALTSGEKTYCYFLWYGCENPFGGWTKSIGDTLKKYLNYQCRLTKNKCGASNWPSCNCSETKIANQCKFCQLMNTPLAYSLFVYTLGQNYGAPNSQKDKEKEGIEWLYVVFPDLRNELHDAVTQKRGFSETEWQMIIVEASKITDPSNPPSGAQSIASWFTENRSYYEVVSGPPFGVMNYFRGEDYHGQNFLGESTYELIKNGFCYKVTQEWQEITDSGGIPDDSLDAYYKTCVSLEKSPAEALGISHPLINYVYPPEYKVLFTLMYTELKPKERPLPLNILLEYLFEKTPPEALGEVGSKINDQDLVKFADFLGTPASRYVNRDPLNKKIACLVLAAIKPELNCMGRLGWQQWQEIEYFLKKTPIDIIADYLNKISFLEKTSVFLQKILVEDMANSSVLNEPYIDTLGKALHLTEPIYQFYEDTQKLEGRINEAVNKGEEFIQNATNKALVEYPQKALGWMATALSKIAGIDLGQLGSDRMINACRKVDKESDCTGNEVYKRDTSECCDMGLSLVCNPRCRPKPDDEKCDIEKGEVEQTTSDGKILCCFETSGDKCQICRKSPRESSCASDSSKCCQREDEYTVLRDDKYLCCKKVDYKPSEDKCCTNVLQCVMDNFSVYLQNLGDVLIDGPALDELK